MVTQSEFQAFKEENAQEHQALRDDLAHHSHIIIEDYLKPILERLGRIEAQRQPS